MTTLSSINTAVVNASNAFVELEEEFEFLERQLIRGEIAKSTYEAKVGEKLAERERVVATTPHFWLRVLISHPTTGAHITVADCPRLMALKAVKCVPHDGADFDIVFRFGENEHFENAELVKTYRNREASGLVVGSVDVQWKDGMRPAVGESNSFFDWFESSTDERLFGELFRDEVLPNAVRLFHGSWHPNDDFFDDSDSDTTTASTISAC